MMNICFSCSAELGDFDVCPSCDLPQVASVVKLHERATKAEQRAESTRGVLIVAVLLSMAVGAGLSAVVTTPRAKAVVRDEVAQEAMRTPLARDLANDLFIRTIDDKLHLGIQGWLDHSSGVLVLEMRPRSEANPRPLWEEFTDPEREEIMEFLGAAYTVTLFRTGNPVNVETQGHPPLALRYYGTEAPVATRAKDGSVRIYPSPYRR